MKKLIFSSIFIFGLLGTSCSNQAQFDKNMHIFNALSNAVNTFYQNQKPAPTAVLVEDSVK